MQPFVHAVMRLGRRAVERVFVAEQWSIGIVPLPIECVLDVDAWSRANIRWLPSPGRGRLLADPFGLQGDTGLTILAEDLAFRKNRGSIAAFYVLPSGEWTKPRTALALESHLAYPYLFVHDDQIYCLPDSSGQGEVNLFRAVEFPLRWERAATLIRDYAATDSTLFRFKDHWWLLCGREGDMPNARLHGWYSSDLFSGWRPHPIDPLKVDVRSSRGAGTPFIVSSVLYRPAQDCSETYGGAITINRVLELSPTSFREEAVRSIRPAPDSPYPLGCHTLSGAGSVTLIDGRRRIVTLGKIAHVARYGSPQRPPGVQSLNPLARLGSHQPRNTHSYHEGVPKCRNP